MEAVCGMYEGELHTGAPERNRPFGKPRHRRDVFIWIFNRINGTEWIYMAQEFMTSNILIVKTMQKANSSI